MPVLAISAAAPNLASSSSVRPSKAPSAGGPTIIMFTWMPARCSASTRPNRRVTTEPQSPPWAP